MSCKILGSDSELNMWQPELHAGLIIISSPKELPIPEDWIPPDLEKRKPEDLS